MGQNLSADASEVIHFRKMVKHSFHGNAQKLEKHFDEASADFQVSRASYIDLCNRIEGKINTITDSLKREAALEKHLTEKMGFYAAIEDGRIVLGDTLFHIAVRAGHVDVVLFLLSKGLRENIPNFRGQLVFECCRHPSIQIIMDDVVLVHDVLGYDYDDEAKVHRMVKSLRSLWPLWMYDSTEATSLVQVISETRTSHPQYAKYLKIACTMAESYRNHVTQRGLALALTLLKENDLKAYDAKRTFHKWPTAEKLQVVWDILSTCFASWKHSKSVEKDAAYLAFIDDAMSCWITIADDMRLYHEDSSFPTASNLMGYDSQLWKKRLAPPQNTIEDMCAHIDGVEKFVGLSHLKV